MIYIYEAGEKANLKKSASSVQASSETFVVRDTFASGSTSYRERHPKFPSYRLQRKNMNFVSVFATAPIRFSTSRESGEKHFPMHFLSESERKEKNSQGFAHFFLLATNCDDHCYQHSLCHSVGVRRSVTLVEINFEGNERTQLGFKFIFQFLKAQKKLKC